MLIMLGCGGPRPIWMPKDFLHPIWATRVSLECMVDRMHRKLNPPPPLCDDVITMTFVDYDEWKLKRE